MAQTTIKTEQLADDAVTSAKLDTNIAIDGTLDVAGAVVFNEGSADVDFRVESNGSANMLFVDGGNNEVLVQKAASGGTATAGSVLIVEGDDNTELSLLGGSSSVLAINFGHSGDVDDAIIAYNTTSGSENMAFTVNAAERMRITSAGNVGIAVTNPYARIHLKQTTTDHYGVVMEASGNDAWVRMGHDGTDGRIHTTYNSSAGATPLKLGVHGRQDALTIDTSGYLYNPSMLGSSSANSDVRFNTSDGLIYYQTSSQRYKENIQDLPLVLDNINALRPVTFDEISTGKSCFGLIAEEVIQQIPELVNLKEIEGYDEPQPDNIPYSMLSVYLLKAIQEQQVIIDDLKSRMKKLEDA